MKTEGNASPEEERSALERLPKTPVQRLVRPFVRFLHIESASGMVLLVCTAVALFLANSPWAAAYDEFWHIHLSIVVGSWELNESLAHWVNDALMTIFFFVVGLEIKRELVDGELREPKKAALPIMAALGGMIAPAAIYLSFQFGEAGESGWGIPMATDIAFVVGFLALLGKRAPLGLKILLLALAIADDIGAVLVIAVFYSSEIALLPLACAAIGFTLIYFCNRIGVRTVTVYVILGAGIWLGFFYSGVHPTVAGVILGLMTPGSAWLGQTALREVIADAIDRLDGVRDRPHAAERTKLVGELTSTAQESVSPLERLEIALHPWVAFAIMPLFALANAGVQIDPSAFGQPVALAVAAGLILGKPLGIVTFSWLAVRAGWASLPAGVNWLVMVGAGCLAGIGFTMSLFIAALALNGELLDAGKIGILAGSAVSAVAGMGLLMFALPRE
ncbi:MAG: Na+/H+ antiporter NhaA [Pirellulales bacterium]